MKVTYLNVVAVLSILILSGCQSIKNNNMSRLDASSRNIVAETQHNNAKVLDDGGTGPYKAVILEDETLPCFTIYRPENMNVFSGTLKLPIVLWCIKDCHNTSKTYEKLLNEIASYGYIVIAVGSYSSLTWPLESGFKSNTDSSPVALDALDWAVLKNNSKKSEYYEKIDVTKVAVAGQLCDGLEVIKASVDRRVTTSMIFNSGIMDATIPDDNLTFVLSKEILKKLHVPILYIGGQLSDAADTDDSEQLRRIDNVPVVMMLNRETKNTETYLQPNGGSFAIAAIAWLDWQLEADASMFNSIDCNCPYSLWKIEHRNFK